MRERRGGGRQGQGEGTETARCGVAPCPADFRGASAWQHPSVWARARACVCVCVSSFFGAQRCSGAVCRAERRGCWSCDGGRATVVVRRWSCDGGRATVVVRQWSCDSGRATEVVRRVALRARLCFFVFPLFPLTPLTPTPKKRAPQNNSRAARSWRFPCRSEGEPSAPCSLHARLLNVYSCPAFSGAVGQEHTGRGGGAG